MGKRIVITDLPFKLEGSWGSCSEHLVIHGNGSITDTKGHDIGKCVEEPEIIRCKDCKFFGSRHWCNFHRTDFYEDDFCSYGERKE